MSPEPTPARIAHALREQIITGELAMGSKLNEREIAERLQVSRIPVREALPILESEGFITTQPRRGAVVHVLTVTDAAEVFDLRRQLEPMASAFAARRAAAGADVEPMLAALRSAQGAAHPVDATSADAAPPSTRNSDLHEEIIALADHALLRRVTKLMSGRVRWLFRLTPQRDTTAMWVEHREIVDAIVAGQVDVAELLTAAHVERGRLESMPLLTGLLPAEAPAPRGRRRRPAPAAPVGSADPTDSEPTDAGPTEATEATA
ncbi:GntR family transcriptional regulator [Frigoribacterium sp. PhB160]|uniref:GntR family transcriptional regulator n=1 Tax=Frigoribacterium sp. PhB160 TaxID=2485192 RepID=UPI000F9C422A|nr:GntR family transcriptional regulator [Frigoribacterium sp. PhB160]ROS58252.1 GntR family transcriptional regulator [Frigoribacterium sp. PhB160]